MGSTRRLAVVAAVALLTLALLTLALPAAARTLTVAIVTDGPTERPLIAPEALQRAAESVLVGSDLAIVWPADKRIASVVRFKHLAVLVDQLTLEAAPSLNAKADTVASELVATIILVPARDS